MSKASPINVKTIDVKTIENGKTASVDNSSFN